MMTVFIFEKRHTHPGLDETRIFRDYDKAMSWLEGSTKTTMMGMETCLDYGDIERDFYMMKSFTRSIFWNDREDNDYGDVCNYCVLSVTEKLVH